MPRQRWTRRLSRFALVLVLVVGATRAVAAADLEEADAAFYAGKYERALALYDEVLAGDPENAGALLRSGKLLSWDRRFDEALARYARLLAVEPDHREALLERAKVLSWDRRFEEASGAFRALLERDDANRDARLGLARTLSWSGKQEAARREYETLLERDPRDAEALVGVAQTHAWSGRSTEARRWYGRVLETEPDRREAVLGLAYLDLWAGNLARADARADELEERFPDDRDVGELRDAIRKTGAPSVRGTWDRVDDTDDNEMDVYRVETAWGPGARTRVRLGVARYDMTSGSASGSIDSIYAVLGWTPRSGHALQFRLGTDRLNDTEGNETSEGIGGIVYTFSRGGNWTLRMSANRDTFRYSTEILDNGIVIDAREAVVHGRASERWRVEAAAGAWDLSGDPDDPGDNERTSARAGAWCRWPAAPVTLETGYVFRYMDYDRDPKFGYFAPSDFTAHLAQLRLRGNFGSERSYWQLGVEGGVQSFTRDTVEVNDDTVLGFDGVAGFPLGAELALELYANRTDFALQSATGFRSRHLGVRLRWKAER